MGGKDKNWSKGIIGEGDCVFWVREEHGLQIRAIRLMYIEAAL